MGPNTAFCLILFGLLGVYCEFIWPGRVWQAVLGCAAAIMGCHFLWLEMPTRLGLASLASATALFLIDTYIDTRFVLGIAATCSLTNGFLKLIAGHHRLNAWLVVPWCVVFGAITMTLNWAARRARRNKRTFSA